MVDWVSKPNYLSISGTHLAWGWGGGGGGEREREHATRESKAIRALGSIPSSGELNVWTNKTRCTADL